MPTSMIVISIGVWFVSIVEATRSAYIYTLMSHPHLVSSSPRRFAQTQNDKLIIHGIYSILSIVAGTFLLIIAFEWYGVVFVLVWIAWQAFLIQVLPKILRGRMLGD